MLFLIDIVYEYVYSKSKNKESITIVRVLILLFCPEAICWNPEHVFFYDGGLLVYWCSIREDRPQRSAVKIPWGYCFALACIGRWGRHFPNANIFSLLIQYWRWPYTTSYVIVSYSIFSSHFTHLSELSTSRNTHFLF